RARPRDDRARAGTLRARARQGSELRAGAPLPRAGALRDEEGRAGGDQVVGEVPGGHAGRRGPRPGAAEDRRGAREGRDEDPLARPAQRLAELRRTASGTANTASPFTTTTGTVHTTSILTTPWPALVTTTSLSARVTPAALAALITLRRRPRG